ncbi:MAG: response regulator [Gemmatimonadales bacterium]|nr:response regulator [Gemmatimonadales bacterium]MBA3556860.1 response regulator [Gemmatimonadales bacterium]
MDEQRTGGSLALVIEDDPEARRSARALLEARGYDVVHASNGLAGLELIQRLPESFRLVLTELDLQGLPGPALIEALRLFRPDLPVLCVSGRRSAVLAGGCLEKPLRAEELDVQLGALQGGMAARWDTSAVIADEQAIARAKARYALAGDLVEAALELARGAPGDE